MAPVSDVEVEVSPGSDRGSRGRTERVLSRDDVLCPVCLEVFMEPVTLPCTHTFCKGCFLESVDKATLCCPMCRKRVSTWARLHSRTNTLVNQQLWRQIQTCFPLQCQRRLSGQDADDDDRPVSCFPRVSQPGELRQEYEDQITKLTEERRLLDEEERRASEEFIQRLLQEEEELLQEETRRREEDERLARLLSNQLNCPAVSQKNHRPVDVPSAKKKDVGVGQIDRFLCRGVGPSSSSCSFMSNKENILQAEHLLHDHEYSGAQTDLHLASEEEEEQQQHHLGSQLITHGGPSSVKRKSSDLETTEEEEEAASTKRGRHVPIPSSSSSSSFLEEGVLPELEVELHVRRRQEEEDRRLAQLLQKVLDQEEKQRATDRRKGSADAYLLRHVRGGTKVVGTATPSKASGKTTKASSSSSSSSSRGRKQTTLTEMFSSPSS